MPVFTDIDALEAAISKEVGIAMRKLRPIIKKDLRKGNETFYEGKQPKVYQRTHALLKSNAVTDVTGGGNSYEVEGYLNLDYQYKPKVRKPGSPNSGFAPTGLQVATFANYGEPFYLPDGSPAQPLVGHPGFFERGIDYIDEDIDKVFHGQGFE